MPQLFPNLDTAKRLWDGIAGEVAQDGAGRTEADTRFRVIDRMLADALGWPRMQIMLEEPIGSGYADYVCYLEERARLVVEVKKDGRDLGLKLRNGFESYDISGAAFRSPNAREGIEQAIRYCGRKNVELACVTNGREWIIFRGSRPGEGIDTEKGKAIIFKDLNDVSSRFDLFYDLLSPTQVANFTYKRIIRVAEEGQISRPEFARSVKSPNNAELQPSDNRSEDFERVLKEFFSRITSQDDAEMLRDCFVESPESGVADIKLARIAQDLAKKISTLNTGTAKRLISRIANLRRLSQAEFVLLVGTKGAGKSTFIDRFFSAILPNDIKSSCVIAQLDLSECVPDPAKVSDSLDTLLLDRLESQVFSGDVPSYDELRGLYFDEYTRRAKGPLKHMYETDKTRFKIEFGEWLEERRNVDKHEYIIKLVQRVVSGRKRLPCIIFDNADHFSIEFQENAFQYARALFENAICLVIMPITDRTSWHLAKEGALRSVETTSFYLPSPDPRKIVEKRVEYIAKKIKESEGGKSSQYFVGKGIEVQVQEMSTFISVINQVFVTTGNISEWIGQLANHDVRRMLEIVRDVAISPYIPFDALLKIRYGETADSIPDRLLKKALILGVYDRFVPEQNRYIHNIFGLLDSESGSNFRAGGSPLVGLRILGVLNDRTGNEQRSFLSKDDLLEIMNSEGLSSDVTALWTTRLLERGLVLANDPTVLNFSEADSLSISPSGSLHVRWSVTDDEYIKNMGLNTLITDRTTYEGMREACVDPRGEFARERRLFVSYLLAQDSIFLTTPPVELSQQQALAALRQMS